MFTKVNDFFVSIPVDRIRFEIAVQHILLRMQNYAKMPSEHFEFHLFDDIERMIALLCASFHNFVHNIVRMYRFVIM